MLAQLIFVQFDGAVWLGATSFYGHTNYTDCEGYEVGGKDNYRPMH